jgi:hypothetical protein
MKLRSKIKYDKYKSSKNCQNKSSKIHLTAQNNQNIYQTNQIKVRLTSTMKYPSLIKMIEELQKFI